MQTILFKIPMKPGKLAEYRKFLDECIGPKKAEYSKLLKRYGLLTAKVWYQKIDGKEYAFVFHTAEDDALKRLKSWPSDDPFEVWFNEQLENCYSGAPEPAEFLGGFEA